MSRIRSASIVVLLEPTSDSADKSSTEEYQDFEEVSMDPDSDGCVTEEFSTKTSKALLDELSDRALEAASRSDKVVVRHSASDNVSCQDSLVNRLIAGGANHENITVVRLATDHKGAIPRNGSFYRTNYCTWRPKTTLLA